MTKEAQLDLLLVNPGSRGEVYQSLGSTLAAIEPPVWAGLMATFVRRQGFSVQILDANAEGLGSREAAEMVAQIDPTLTAVVVYGHQPSASTQNMPAAGTLCTQLKEQAPQTRILLLGGHVAALPERTLLEEDTDFTCDGEGLYTLVDLLNALKSDRPGDLGGVRGLWYHDGRNVQSNRPAPLVTNLDRLMPEMAWDLLPMDKYRAHNWHCFDGLNRQPYASLYTTLGCPFHCSFCCIQAPFRSGEAVLGYKPTTSSYRFFSPNSILDQLDKLVSRHGVRNVKFADELFVLNQKHVDGICDGIIERGYDLNIWAYARVDTVRDAMVEKLKQAGVNWLAFGIEAGSDRVRDNVSKGVTQAEVFKTIEAVRAAGINVIGNYIFGLPEDDLQSMQETLDMAQELNCEFANFYCAMAYPGSRLYQLAAKEGWPLPEQWSGYSQHSVDTLPLPTKYLTGGKVLRFRDEGFHVYFNNVNYLSMTEAKFGTATAQHIREMASAKLERRHVDQGDSTSPSVRHLLAPAGMR